MGQFNFEIEGYYQDKGKIKFQNGNSIELLEINEKYDLPFIPYGAKVRIIIKYDEIDLLNGTNGIVWATYNYSQADTIKNALFVQNIFGKIIETILETRTLYNICITNSNDVKRAIDFIWKDERGMRLLPDWHYPANSENESFNKWINGY